MKDTLVDYGISFLDGWFSEESKARAKEQEDRENSCEKHEFKYQGSYHYTHYYKCEHCGKSRVD